MSETAAEKVIRERKEADEKARLANLKAPHPVLPAPAEGAQESKPPHRVVLADGVRGNDEVAASTTKAPTLVHDGERAIPTEVFVKELEALHDEIERLTLEYTQGGLQVSDFPASYHALTNSYRIKAAALNRGVGGVGPEEARVMAEMDALKAQYESKLAAARALDAKKVAERKL